MASGYIKQHPADGMLFSGRLFFPVQLELGDVLGIAVRQVS